VNTQFPRFDLYRELGVEPTATQADITAAWRAQVEAARSGGPAAQRIQRLNAAHQWLGDPTRRAQYDRELARRARAGESAAQREAQRMVGVAARPARERARGTVRSGSAGSTPLLLLIVGAVAVLVFVVGVLRPFDGGSGGPGTSVSPSASTTASTSAGIAGCPTSQPAPLPAGESRIVTIETALGEIEIRIDGSLSPIAAGNFVALASCGYYEDVVFHRTASLGTGTPFVIQGGDPSGTGSGGPGYTIQDETVTTQYHRGTVAMARTAAPNSVGSQFFIVLSEEARGPLESANTYQIIGSVTAGMETADAIHAASGGAESPSSPVAMTTVTVTEP
jgi:peptidyl-prolyl cis-trans isomerase B (cyclophilin B)